MSSMFSRDLYVNDIFIVRTQYDIDIATQRIYEHIIDTTFNTSKFMRYLTWYTDVRKGYLQ